MFSRAGASFGPAPVTFGIIGFPIAQLFRPNTGPIKSGRMHDAFDEVCRIAENKGRAFPDFIFRNGIHSKDDNAFIFNCNKNVISYKLHRVVGRLFSTRHLTADESLSMSGLRSFPDVRPSCGPTQL